MRFASLGSGSEGNALVVESGGTRVLLDCGFGLRETATRLAQKQLMPEDISAIVITHEHSDHLQGAVRFARKYAIKLWMTYGTHRYLLAQHDELPAVELIDSHSAFNINALHLQPFPVPHDAREPVQFVFSDGQSRLGILTDTGTITPHIANQLDACDALVLECNHDAHTLQHSHYPASLKNRIAGQFGHLDNQTAASLLSRIDTSKLRHLIAAHLSQQNNTPELALTSLTAVLGCHPDWLDCASQQHGFDWREL